MKSILAICTLLLVHALFAATQRLRPPEKIGCSRDHLTSFSGRVIAFKRDNKETFLKIRTDEETTETFVLKHPGKDSAVERFLLRGGTFEPTDWNRIEEKKNKLRRQMRATVWVCDDGSMPVVDWQPPLSER